MARMSSQLLLVTKWRPKTTLLTQTYLIPADDAISQDEDPREPLIHIYCCFPADPSLFGCICDPVTYFDLGQDGEPICGNSLTPAQLADLHTVWQQFRYTLSSRPGRTTITEHRINTGQAKPVRLPHIEFPMLTGIQSGKSYNINGKRRDHREVLQ